jgi:hypothetical protein
MSVQEGRAFDRGDHAGAVEGDEKVLDFVRRGQIVSDEARRRLAEDIR